MKTEIALNTFVIPYRIDLDDREKRNEMAMGVIRLVWLARDLDFRHSLLHPDNNERGEALIDLDVVNIGQYAHKGDRVFLYLIPDNTDTPNRIFASGFVKVEPNVKNKLRVDMDCVMSYRLQLDLLMQPTLELQFPDYDWSDRTTDFMLDSDSAYMFEQKWYNYLSDPSQHLPRRDFWCQSRDGFASMYEWQDEDGNYDIGPAKLYMTNLEMERKIAKLPPLWI